MKPRLQEKFEKEIFKNTNKFIEKLPAMETNTLRIRSLLLLAYALRYVLFFDFQFF